MTGEDSVKWRPAPVLRQDIARRIRALRRCRGWSQERLSKRTGYHVNTIKKAEKGGDMDFETYRVISEALDVDMAVLLMPHGEQANEIVRHAQAASQTEPQPGGRPSEPRGDQGQRHPSRADIALALLGLHRGNPVIYRHRSAHALYSGSESLHPDNLHGLIAASGQEQHPAVDPAEGLADYTSRDLALVGSPTAEGLSRRLFGYRPDGAPDSLEIDALPVDLPYRWVISRCRIDERAIVRRFVAGRGVVERPNWRIEGPHRMYVPRADADGFMVDDYLLVTKLRNYSSRSAVDTGHFILSFGGTHGTGTRAIGLLLRHQDLLGRIARQLSSQPAAFQLLFHVSDIVHSPTLGSYARRIDLVEDAVILPDTESVWRTAVQIAERYG